MATIYAERYAATEKAGSIAEAAGGIALIVLSIIALGGVASGILTEIAIVVLGAALLTEGGAVITEYAHAMAAPAGTASTIVGSGNGVMSVFLVGGTVLVLGILSLIGVAPEILVPASIIAAGALMLVTAPMMVEIAEMRRASLMVPETAVPLLRASAASVSGLQILASLAAIVLGILALVAGSAATTGAGLSPVLPLVALLILGAALTFNGTALTAGMFRLFSR